MRCLPSITSREGCDVPFPSSGVKLNFVHSRHGTSPLLSVMREKISDRIPTVVVCVVFCSYLHTFRDHARDHQRYSPGDQSLWPLCEYTEHINGSTRKNKSSGERDLEQVHAIKPRWYQYTLRPRSYVMEQDLRCAVRQPSRRAPPRFHERPNLEHLIA